MIKKEVFISCVQALVQKRKEGLKKGRQNRKVGGREKLGREKSSEKRKRQIPGAYWAAHLSSPGMFQGQ